MAPDSPLIDTLAELPMGAGGHAPTERTRRQVLFGLLLLNLLMAAVCTALLLSSRRSEIADAKAQTLNDVRLTEQVASALFDKAAIALGAVGVQVERQLGGSGLDASILWSIVDTQAAQVPEVQRIGVFDARGAQLCGVPAERCQRLDIADRDYFQRLRDHPDDPIKLYGPYDIRTDGRPALVLARSMRMPDGRFAGVLIAVMPVERLRALVSTLRLGSSGSVSLRTADLALLLRQPELTGPDAAAAGRKVSDQLRAAIAAEPGEGVYRAVTASDGVDRVAAYRRLGKHALYVIVGRATGDFLTGWRLQVAWTAGFLLIFAVVSWQLARATSSNLREHAQALRLYDEAPCGYHTLDPSGTYLSINATELAWLGCSREEVVGKLKPTDFFTDEGRSTFAANFPKLERTGQIEALDLDLVSRDGTVRRVLVNATAVKDTKGGFLHSNSVMYDITELHLTRTQLHALALQQGVMLDNDLIGIVRLKDRRILWKNQAMDRIFGYANGDWDDMPSRDLYLDDESHRRAGAELVAALEQGQVFRCQLPMRRKDGSPVWIDASGASLVPGTGEVMMLLADITALKAAEAERLRAASLEAQNFQLRETNRLKSELVANMSHELRTPLNAILGFGQMLESGSVKPDSPKYASYIRRIVSSGKHLLSLIDQVLDFAKVESGKMTFDPEPISVPHALHEVVEMLQADSASRQIAVRVDVDDGVESVITDPLRLKQMLLALVGNAIKFSHEGGSVDLRASVVDDAFWQVDIIDRGIGIEEANLARLFSPFVQLSSGSTKTHGGTGIGLSLVRLIAQAQGGRIEVRSQFGAGSTFSLILPRALGETVGPAK